MGTVVGIIIILLFLLALWLSRNANNGETYLWELLYQYLFY